MGDQDHKRPEDAGTSPDRRSPYPYEYPEDEISLVDLWLVLARRKWTILVTILMVLAIGIVYVFAQEAQYRYTTTIEIARIPTGDNIRDVEPIAPAKMVSLLIEEKLLPVIQQEMQEKNVNSAVGSIDVQSTVPGDAKDVVRIQSEGTAGMRQAIRELHNDIVNKLVEHHNEQLAEIKEELEQEQELVQTELEQLEKEQNWLEESVAEAEGRLADLRNLLQNASLGTTDASHAMSQLLLQSQIQNSHERLLDLREKLDFLIPLKRASIQQRLDTTDRKISRIEPTEATVIALQSSTPIGTSKQLIAALSLVLGIMLGVFAAFFREFLANVQKAAESSV